MSTSRMQTKIYTKPSLRNTSRQTIGWARSANIAMLTPTVAFADFVGEHTTISKSIAIDTTISKVWDVIGDPQNAPAFTPGLISMEDLGDNKYMATVMIPPASGDEWKTESYEEEIIDKQENKVIHYRLLHPSAQADYIFSLEENDNKALLSGKLEIGHKISNHDEMANDLENILYQVAKLAMSPDDLVKKIKKFEGRS